MHTKTYISESKDETMAIGRSIARTLEPGAVVVLSGDLGAGKTTLTQGLLEGLGIAGPYTSPTFVLMKQYATRSALHPRLRRVYHADAYRASAQEMLSIGWEEWLEDPEGVVIIEWPERIAELIPEECVTVLLEWVSETKRKIVIKI